MSAGTLLVQNHGVIGLLIALLIFSYYALGGIGVREHSQIAATFVAVTYWLDQIAGIMTSTSFPGFFGIVAGVLLIANVRGCWIAAKWAREGGPDAMPERRTGNFRDWLVDQMPAKVWPVMRIPFYVIATVYALLAIFGMVIILTLGGVSKVKAAKPVVLQQELHVAPSR